MAALDLAKSAKVDVLDQVIAINRLGKVANRTHAASVERINAVVQRPRLFYVPGGDAGRGGRGLWSSQRNAPDPGIHSERPQMIAAQTQTILARLRQPAGGERRTRGAPRETRMTVRRCEEDR